GVLDAKTIGKVKQFDGSRRAWSTWEFHWRACTVANYKRCKDLFEELDDKTLGQLDDAKNATMSADGGQAWTRLKGEYAPHGPGNVVARLRQLMSTQFATNADVANEIEKLDVEISRYEKVAEKQLSDNIQEGILLGALQNEHYLQKHVFRKLRNLATYLDVKNEVLSALKAQRSFDDDAMETGAPNGKPKGKGKGKGDKDKDNDNIKNKFEPQAKDNPNHSRKWCSHCEKPNHVKDDCRKFEQENEAKAEAYKKAKDEKMQRRATAAALAAGQHSQHLAHRAARAVPQQPVPNSSRAASTASATPTVPTCARGINGLFAEQDTIIPKCIFAPSVEHSRPRARSAEPSGSRRSASGGSVCVSGIRGVRVVTIDSGAQITACPYDMLKGKGCVLAKSGISKPLAIDGTEAQHCGKTDVRLKTGQDVIQISAEVADVEFPAMSTFAIAKQGKSAIHSPFGDWIVDSPGKRAVRSASIGELDESIGGLDEVIGEQLGEELYLSATRATLRAQVPATEARQQLPTALGPGPSENATLKAKALAGPGRPSEEERRAHAVHHLPFRPRRRHCVTGRARDTPNEVSAQPKGDEEHPIVEMDFFYVATDEIAGKCPMVNGCVAKVVDFRNLEHKGRGELPAILNVAGCRAHFVATLIHSWGHATVILLADDENAIVALAGQVKKLRSHSTIARQGPEYSSKTMGHIEASNGAAAGLLRTLRFSLEAKLGCKLELSDPIPAFFANTVGWYIARFQPRSRGGWSYKYLFGHECAGEVAEVGEQVRRRIAARVAVGQGNFEARFAKGIWVGKSEFDDQHVLVDLQRGLLKVRSVRRMPEEFRRNADLVKQIDVTPWAPVHERVRSVIRKSMYITENMLSTRGPTDSCPKCTYGRGQHSEQCRIGALVQAPEVVVIAGLSVCELAVCEEDDDQAEAPLGPDAGGCLIGCAKKLNPDAEVVASLCALWSRRRAREQPDWNLDPDSPEPTVKIHYDYYTGELLDEEKYQKGKADELQAMAEHGVYRKIRIADCGPGGKHVGGFPVAREKAGEAFFNSDPTEKICAHPGSELCERGYCWELFKNVRATTDDAGGKALKCAPGMFYFANLCSGGNGATSGVHGDGFIAEGHVGAPDQLGDVLSVEYEITSSPPLGPGHPGVARYLKRACGNVDQLPETTLAGFFWHADPKHVTEITKFGSKEGAKAVDAPGAKAIGAQLRNVTDPLPTAEARKTASAGGLALCLAADRPDITLASKTIMQDVSKPNYQMNARLMRLARYLEGHQVLVWCCELQGLPSILRADGDADWAAPTAVARKSTSGGAIRFGNHTWECNSASQATQALSSGESEFYALGATWMTGAAMMPSTPPATPGAAAAKDQCEMDNAGEKLEAVLPGVFQWLLVSVVVVLCMIAHLCGWCVGRRKAVLQTAEEDPRAALIGERHRHHEGCAESKQQQRTQAIWRLEEHKYITREVQRLYEVHAVGELRELPVERVLALKDGYARKEELVESAGGSSPTEMHVITQLTNEWKDHGIDVKWRPRMLASGRDIQRMLTAAAEVMNRLRE
ncbi:unnamed protein product, partial [Prorocentrum cordatum]